LEDTEPKDYGRKCDEQLRIK